MRGFIAWALALSRTYGGRMFAKVWCRCWCIQKKVANFPADALTIKQTSGTSYVTGGGAFHASDKIVQHNGGGTVSIKDFYAEDFGKVYLTSKQSTSDLRLISDRSIAPAATARRSISGP